jgi:hypothetical protein
MSGHIDVAPAPGRPIVGHTTCIKIDHGVLSMIRQTIVTAPEADADDPSMRVLEWALALIAVIAAGVLAFIR